jgi:hypothetical protein
LFSQSLLRLFQRPIRRNNYVFVGTSYICHAQESSSLFLDGVHDLLGHKQFLASRGFDIFATMFFDQLVIPNVARGFGYSSASTEENIDIRPFTHSFSVVRHGGFSLAGFAMVAFNLCNKGAQKCGVRVVVKKSYRAISKSCGNHEPWKCRLPFLRR